MNYEIKGENLPVVICQLEENETMICQKGGMSWMSPNMEMETSGKAAGGFFSRMVSGESAFVNKYTAKGHAGMIAFASRFPGAIKAVKITAKEPVLVQKMGFLACTEGVTLSAVVNNLGTGLFGGEGFIMQKLSGEGMAFVEVDGAVVEYELQQGESILVDTGHLAMLDVSCQMEVRSVKGLKNKFLGGEGLFNTVVHGPGRVVLQTMPITGLVKVLRPFFPTSSD